MATNVSFGSLVDPEQQDIERRRAMAQALMQQGATAPQQQTAGGMTVATSPLENIAKVVQLLRAKKINTETDAAQKSYVERKKSEGASEMQSFVDALRGKPAQSYAYPQGITNDDEGNALPKAESAAVPPNPEQALILAMQSQSPMLQAASMTMLNEQVKPKKPIVVGRSLLKDDGTVIGTDATWDAEQKAAREQRAAEAQAKREERQAEIEMRLADQRTSREDAAKLRKEIADMNNQARADMLRLSAALRPAPTPVQPQMVTTQEGVFQVGRDGKATPVMANGVPLTGKPVQPPGKALPVSAAQKLMENNQNLRKAEQALALIEGGDVKGIKGDKNATGWKGYVPDAILQRTDPQGIATRAAIGDLGSMVIHDRSGAAVTAAEFPRLKPFIPQTTDDPVTVKKKLNRFAQEYRALVEETTEFYKGSGYNVPDLAPSGVQPKNNSVRDAADKILNGG